MAPSDAKLARQFEITLATPAGLTEDEATRRLRSLLKLALRSFGLRCVAAVEVGHAASDHSDSGRPVPSARGPT